MTTIKALALWAVAVGVMISGWYLFRGFPVDRKDLEELKQRLSEMEKQLSKGQAQLTKSSRPEELNQQPSELREMEQRLSKVQAQLTETNRLLMETRAIVDTLRPPVTPIRDTSCSLAGKGSITVAGKIAERNEGKGRVELTLSDGTGTITVPVFANTHISTERLRQGVSISVHSYIQCHNQKPEIVPEKPADIIYQ